MKLRISLVLDVDGESTLDDARALRTAVTVAARQGRGVRFVDDVHATIEIPEVRPVLRPLAKTDAPLPLARVLELSIPFAMAAAQADVDEHKAMLLLAHIPPDQAADIIAEARRRFIRESNAVIRRNCISGESEVDQ